MCMVGAQAFVSKHRPAVDAAACWITVLLVLLYAAGGAPQTASAAEQAEEFLEGLKQRGLNELALEYLERMKTSRLAEESFRKRIPYHRGVVLLEQSRQTADPAARSRLLDEARDELERYSGANPESVQAAEAQLQLASIQLERGHALIAQAKLLPLQPEYDDQRRALSRDARTQFADARQVFESAAAIFNAELAKLPPTSAAEASDGSASTRQEYRARVAQLRFLAAQSRFEIAQSYSPGDDEHRSFHEAAAAEFASLFDEFARSTSAIVGLYARLYEGRCYQALEQYPMALGCYDDILAQSNVLPPFRKVIASAVQRKAEVLLDQQKYAEAIDLCTACLEDAQPDETTMPEWLAVRFRLGQALQQQAAALPAGSIDQRRKLADMRNAFRLVAAAPGEFQAEARDALSSTVRGNGASRADPQTFQAAYDLGKDALASYNAAKLALPSAEKNNPSAVSELQQQMDQGKADARNYFRLATALVDDDTKLEQLNEVRYFLCWLYWEAEDFYRAAVLGEFLARRYPDHPAARSAAKISMAAYEWLYRQAAENGSAAGSRDEDTQFEARRMAQMAEFIARRWPGTDDADAAFGVLVSYSIRNNRLDEAEQMLSEASPQLRPRLELQLGNAIWARYLELARSAGDEEKNRDRAALKQSAMRYLRGGFDTVRANNQITDSAATAGLYLAQILLDDEQYAEAIELLEDSQAGPLTLITQGHPAASRPEYIVEAYKAALRAYVLVTPPQEEKAVAAMRSLEQAVKSSGEVGANAAEQLTRIYIALGLSLQKQIEELNRSGRSGQAQRLTSAFTKFLERISDSPTESDWATQMWLAQTYFNLGTGLQSNHIKPAGPSTTPPAPAAAPATGIAREYFTSARAAYQRLIAQAANDSSYAPGESAVLAAKLQLGESLRALGEYQPALDMFSEVLTEKESSLVVQRAAAYTYQQRGEFEDPRWLERAIYGGYKLRSTGQNRIWGWLKISQVALRAARADDRYRDAFYEARFNAARCRYLMAMKSRGAARQEHLSKAKQSIVSLARLYPGLGGEQWRGQFEMLLKSIESASRS